MNLIRPIVGYFIFNQADSVHYLCFQKPVNLEGQLVILDIPKKTSYLVIDFDR